MRIFALELATGVFLLASTPVFAQQTPPQRPPAPVVTVGADLKELTFDWDPVSGAYTYWLMQKIGTGPHIYYSRVGERISGGRTRAAIPVSVHLQNWQNLRYAVDACNAAGCTRSNEVFPRDLMLDTIGYVKASNTDPQDRFGRALAMSADGSTLAVSAEGESSKSFIGYQDDNSAPNSGAVYVYRRNGRKWAQEAYIKMTVYPEPQSLFGGGSPLGLNTLAISGDGSLLAVAAPSRSLGNPTSHEGTVYVYRRAADNTWSNLAHFLAPGAAGGDYFGYSIDMSQDGQTIKVSSMEPHDVDIEGVPVGRTHIFVRTADDNWEESVSLAPYYPGDRCHTTRMSGNGKVLVSACLNPLVYEYRAVTRKLIGGAWVHVSDVPLDYYMSQQPIALNYQGTRLAINRGGGNDGGEAGATVGVYRWENSAWVEEGRIGQPRYNLGRTMSVGWAKALEFDRSGNFLAIGDAGAPPPGAGVLDVLYDGDDPQGAVYLYDYSAGYWKVHIVKAPNPATDDQFGISVALSGNGHILAAGAVGEDSSARGVDGNQSNEGATNSGAVYLY